MDKDFLQSKGFRRLLFGIGVFVVALLIFQCGMIVGFHKASFSYRMGDNYYRAFGTEKGFTDKYPIQMEVMRGNFPDSHGAVGQIITVDLPTIVIEDTHNIEKAILVTEKTTIKKFKETLKKSDLKVDDYVTIIGSPNDKSEIEAKLIRILPPPIDYRTATTSSKITN